MNKKTAGTILAILLIVIGGLRLTFALSEPLLDFDGYRELRLVEHIATTGLPLIDDPLSYLGRERAYSPLYHYILAPWTLILNSTIVLKTIPNIFYVISILFVYFIAQEITQNRTASLLATVLSAFTPITFSQHINDASTYTIAIPLFLLTMYALLKPKERIILLISSSIALSIISPIIFLLIAGLALFLLIAAVEKLTIDRSYQEALFFLLFFALWTTLIFYQEAFLDKGIAALWAYIPEIVLTQHYAELTIIGLITAIGALPIVFGCYATYHALFRKRAHKTLLIIGIGFSTAAALFFRIIPVQTGLAILTLFLCILAAQGFTQLLRFFHKTRAPQIRYAALGIMLFFFVFASALPALSAAAAEMQDTPSEEHIQAAEWLAQRDTVVLATPQEGFYFQYAAGAPTLTDKEYLLIKNTDVLHEETAKVYRQNRKIPALETLNKHGITHIVFSDIARKTYGRSEIKYLPDNCFDPVHGTPTLTIYEVQCNVKTN